MNFTLEIALTSIVDPDAFLDLKSSIGNYFPFIGEILATHTMTSHIPTEF
jgi:hypothetical protein